MKTLYALLLGATMAMAANSVHEFSMKSIDGKQTSLADYKGKVVLFVNVASQCGYTPQYSGLQSLYEKYQGKGLVVVGVPANDFGSQEPGSDAEIKTFCSRNYNVTFPMLSKVVVTGSGKVPLYEYLTQTGGEVKWNFTKFLVGKDGKVRARFESGTRPDSKELSSAVEQALAE